MPQLLIHDETGETYSLRLTSETVTIGRRRGNILRLPNLSVSGFHARITDDKGCLVIEDLNSTNGTIVNGEKIRIRVLVHLDDIIIGSYRISYSETYRSPTRRSDTSAHGVNTQSYESPQTDTPILNPKHSSAPANNAVIKVASGQKAGSVVMLEKSLTTLGKRDGDMGAISKKSTGYYFLPVSDHSEPMKHNGRGLMPQVEVKLVNGDMIEIAGEYLEFIYPYHD